MLTLVAKLAFLAMLAGWYLIRLPHLLRNRRIPVAVSRRGLRERAVMFLSGAGMGYVPLAYCALGFAGVLDRPTHPAILALGIATEILALALFYASHRDLGRAWSVSLELRQDHALRTDGLYRFVRHPMYAAFWTWCLAQALILPNWIAGLSGIVGFGCLYASRMQAEERMMQAQFGEAWTTYAARTPRIVPWRWLLAGLTGRRQP